MKIGQAVQFLVNFQNKMTTWKIGGFQVKIAIFKPSKLVLLKSASPQAYHVIF